jgi:hypothetical protein
MGLDFLFYPAWKKILSANWSLQVGNCPEKKYTLFCTLKLLKMDLTYCKIIIDKMKNVALTL